MLEQLLPLTGEATGDPGDLVGLSLRARPETVIDEMLVRYVEALVYQAVAENMASNRAHAWWR